MLTGRECRVRPELPFATDRSLFEPSLLVSTGAIDSKPRAGLLD
jgi:hypothetical protein